MKNLLTGLVTIALVAGAIYVYATYEVVQVAVMWIAVISFIGFIAYGIGWMINAER